MICDDVDNCTDMAWPATTTIPTNGECLYLDHLWCLWWPWRRIRVWLCRRFLLDDCDCEGNQLDQCGVCGGDGTSCLGCIDGDACNYDETATID